MVKLTIVQPRINNISSWEISVDELIKFAEETIKPAAEKAFKGEGELKAGSWCKFCAVKNKCRELYNENLKIAKHEFAKPEFLTDEEISFIESMIKPIEVGGDGNGKGTRFQWFSK